MSQKYKKLLNNSLLFTIGNLGSKLITFILVPLYTFYLSTSEYGTIDFVTTIGSLLLPIISLSLYDGVLRFVIDRKDIKIDILRGSLKIGISGSIILLSTFFVISKLIPLETYYLYMVLLVSIQIFYSTLSQYARGTGQTILYTISGILITILIALFNILFLVIFNLGINGFLLSYFLANLIVVIVYLIFIKDSKKIFRIYSSSNTSVMKDIIRYSLPLIPNAILWWIISASSKIFIVSYHGLEINGLYGIANKIPTILTLFTYIFTQAWQLSAIEETNSETKNSFFTDVFKYYQAILFVGASFIIIILVPFYKIAISSSFYDSIVFVPILLIAVVFSSFSGFFGTNYLVAKNTRGVLITSLIAGSLSIILNILLIPTFGGIGAAISTAVCYFVLWIVRVYDTRKLVVINFNFLKIIVVALAVILQGIALNFDFNGFIISFALLIFVIFLEKNELINILKQTISFFKNRKKVKND